MTIKFPGGGDPASTVATLRALADDLERMAMFVPGDAELADAPLLADWDFSIRAVTNLGGTVVGHPLLGCRSIYTSEVFAIDADLRWARTFSRFYRLDTRATPPETI
jgi:hypothetical protein